MIATLSEKKQKISDLSQRVEEVLLLLLTENETLKERLETEIHERSQQGDNLKNQLDQETADLKNGLAVEKKAREDGCQVLQAALDAQGKKGNETNEELRRLLEKECTERVDQAQQMDQFFRDENQARKRNLDDVNDWIQTENDKRRREAEALQARMEKEKQELRDYIEKDNKAMKEKLSNEEELRKRQEEEMNEKLKEQEQARENEIIQLYKKMANENIKREEEIDELRARFDQERMDMRAKLVKEHEELRQALENENHELRDKLQKEKQGLQGEIDCNKYDSNNKIKDLSAKLNQLMKDSGSEMKTLVNQMTRDKDEMRDLMSQPLSVYFDAYRTEDYLDGGEQYLTFSKCLTNLGNGLNPESGVFKAPKAGAYLFIIHVCTHDMKKALMTIHKNKIQVASFYDQNHESNHRNSMAGQSVVVDLEVGDHVQIYMFTETGLQDKRSNQLTHFVGLFLRPKDYLLSTQDLLPLTNGH
eukprot:maker-scaffold116_size340332-snap-gene-0.22 protein:Tk07650 transcript:maker-scaffold116_size340332-snap-gene-0.22-mRNA-1 annotation:"Cerebellin-3"